LDGGKSCLTPSRLYLRPRLIEVLGWRIGQIYDKDDGYERVGQIREIRWKERSVTLNMTELGLVDHHSARQRLVAMHHNC
jgi:hypothetical protein